MTIRTRFAPSPTGYLHVGGVRTALFSWLYARKYGGQFILRIEDTDSARSTQVSSDAILEGMAWLGLNYDEGPFYQTQRLDRYQQVIAQLVAQGDAYPCYCTKEELDTMRERQRANQEKPRYDGRCRHRASSKDSVRPVIRFKNPTAGVVVIQDVVRGHVEFQNSELDDLIIARADGLPTYNLTVVVDDIDMGLTHVIRGDDHLNNTPRQVNLFQALAADIPVFAHLPMIVGDDGVRLSKRHGAAGVMYYRDNGFLPDALLNYLVRLGWSHGDQEIFTLGEMVSLFDIKDINKSVSRFSNEKLMWFNQQYIKHSDPEHIARHLHWHMKRLGLDIAQGPDLVDVVVLQQERAKTLADMANNSSFFYRPVSEYDDKAAGKHLTATSIDVLIDVFQRLQKLPHWRSEAIHDEIKACSLQRSIGMGKVAQPVRVAITGKTISPPLDMTLELLGSVRALTAIQNAIAWITESDC